MVDTVLVCLAAAMVAQLASASIQWPALFNWTLDDTSAMITYYPNAAVPLPNSTKPVWNASFANSPWSNYEKGQAGIGYSYHFADNAGQSPTLYFNFPMTQFTILGEATGLDYSNDLIPLSMIIDSRSVVNVTPSDGIVCQVNNLLWGFHKIQLALYSGSWRIDAIQVTTGASINAPYLDNVTQQYEQFAYDNTSMNPFFNFSGSWNVETTIGGVGGQSPVEYTTAVGVNNATVSMVIPANTSFFVLEGTVRPDSDQFMLMWDPLPPLSDNDMTFSAYNPFESQSELYIAPLDPDLNYTLTIAVPQQSNTSMGLLGVHSVTLWNRNSPYSDDEDSQGPSKGAIAGIVIGSVLGALLIAAALWLFFRHRRKQRAQPVQPEGKGNFEVDETPSGSDGSYELNQVTPFVAPARDADSRAVDAPVAATPAYEAGSSALVANGMADPRGRSPPPINTTFENGLQTSLVSAQSYHSHTPPPLLAAPLSAAPRSAITPSTLRQFPTPPLVAMNPDVEESAGPSGTNPIAAELKRGHAPRIRPPPRQRQVAQEEDGGALPDIELVPPVYNPEWARERNFAAGGGASDSASPVDPPGLSDNGHSTGAHGVADASDELPPDSIPSPTTRPA